LNHTQLNILMVNIQEIESINYLEPRRVKKYLFLWCRDGELKIQVDNKLLTVQKNQVLTITSGQYHCFKDINKAKGYMLDFTLDFMCKTEKDIELIFQNSLFCHFDYNEIIPVENPLEIENHLQTIEKELSEKPFQFLNSVHSRIELLLIAVNRAKIASGAEVWKPDALFLQFLEFVRNNFEKNLSLSEISTHLHTTELKLNEQAKLHAGKTAQNVIYGLVASEAKRLLLYGDSTVKEVAFQLGFIDPFYFSNFFKKQTNLSPKKFKEKFAF